MIKFIITNTKVRVFNNITKEKRLPIKPQFFDVKHPLLFPNGYFDAAYSHMLLNMRFSLEDLHFIFSEINRVLKPKAFDNPLNRRLLIIHYFPHLTL